MNKVYVVTELDDNNEIETMVFLNKDIAIATVMEKLYGEDWEIQMNDEEWEASYSI